MKYRYMWQFTQSYRVNESEQESASLSPHFSHPVEIPLPAPSTSLMQTLNSVAALSALSTLPITQINLNLDQAKVGCPDVPF